MDRHHRKYNTDTGVENFILRLRENNSNLSYYSGYKDSESKVKLKCNKCGNILERYASCVRKNSKIRCSECARILAVKRKEYIMQQYRIKRDLEIKSGKLLDNKQIQVSICNQCGKMFIGDTKYCSKECLNKYHNITHTANRKRYKQINGGLNYTITLEKLIKRDNNICHICGKECNQNDYTYRENTFIAGNYYPSIDHVIPLSKGGRHEWNNIKLAHRICNSRKSNKLNQL